MNWAQFKDSVSNISLAGTVVASRPLTQGVTGLSPFTVKTNIFVTEFAEFSKNSNVHNIFSSDNDKSSLSTLTGTANEFSEFNEFSKSNDT